MITCTKREVSLGEDPLPGDADVQLYNGGAEGDGSTEKSTIDRDREEA